MKRIGYLFEKAFTKENLYNAFLDAQKNKRNKIDCYNFEMNLFYNIDTLYNEIHNNNYYVSKYKTFKVYEPKERKIYAPIFRDLVVQHAIYRIIYPIFDKTFIFTSYACRKNKGVHKASNYTQQSMRKYNKEKYFVQLDIKKYFHSIDRLILKRLLEKKIKDKRFINIMMQFTEMETLTGIPIGCLLSQLYALIFLNPLDHYIKRVLKVKHYVRYVDDFLLIGITKTECFEFKKLIINFLRNNFNLELSKCLISKIKKGINFVGYRTWQNKRFIRKYSLFKFRKLVIKGKQHSVASLLGHAKNTNSLIYLFKIIKENNNDIEIPKNYRQLYNLHFT
jgi:RNA-directed DNA polymerase